MKRILAIAIAVAAILVCASSCQKDKFGTYDFFAHTQVNVVDAQRAGEILDIIYEDIYFSQKHSYTEVFSKALNMAANEFDEHVNDLDADAIESKLQFNENVKISLWCMDPGNRWITYVFTPNGMNTEENLVK